MILLESSALIEVEAAKQLADDEDVRTFDNTGLQRRAVRNWLIRNCGPQVGVAAEGGAELQKSSLGAMLARKAVKFRRTDSSQQNGVTF